MKGVEDRFVPVPRHPSGCPGRAAPVPEDRPIRGADGIATALDTARNQLTPAEADAVAADGRVLTLDQLTRYARDGEIDVVPPPDTPLAPREIVIARLVATGHTTRQIAARLAIGTRTVDGHVARARARLGLSSRAQLAAWAAEHLG
jgi:non-specific serine/threonine protein kinase